MSTDTALAHAGRRAAGPGPVLGLAGGFCGEFLIAADLLAGLALIGFSRFVLLLLTPTGVSWIETSGIDTGRAMCLLSVIAALLLREPSLAEARPMCRPQIERLLGGRLGMTLVLLAALLIATATHDRRSLVWPASWLVLFSLWALARNRLILAYVRRRPEQTQTREAVAVVGGPAAAGRIASCISAEANVVAIIERISTTCALELLDDDLLDECFAEVAVLARSGEIDTVIVALEEDGEPEITGLVDRLKALPVQVALCPDPAGSQTSGADLRDLLGLNMALVAARPAWHWGRLVKAVFDRLGAAVLLALCLPLMIVIAIAIASDTAGPVLFRQKRNGWAGRLFTLYKFRTMYHVASEAGGGQTKRNDPRCTRVGAFLRRTSLDELPQLWNVIIGDMSLVGPRPHADVLHARERAGYELIEEYARRQRVVPGMTGWAQVHGLRGGITSPEQLRLRVEYDLYYIDHWSLFLDMRILAMTPLAVLRAENAF